MLSEELCFRCFKERVAEAQRRAGNGNEIIVSCPCLPYQEDGIPPDGCPYLLEHLLSPKELTWFQRSVRWLKGK